MRSSTRLAVAMHSALPIDQLKREDDNDAFLDSSPCLDCRIDKGAIYLVSGSFLSRYMVIGGDGSGVAVEGPTRH